MLQKAYDTLARLPFPEHPDSDDLDDWMLELAETDGYFAGLADSVLKGQRPEARTLPDLRALSESLARISVDSLDDQEIHRQCKAYLEALVELREALLQSLGISR